MEPPGDPRKGIPCFGEGLEFAISRCCAGLSGGTEVPEARGGAAAAAGVYELFALGQSGFYDIPAPYYQGDVQPRAVVYVSSVGQLDRMPASVRGLIAVRELEQAARWELDRKSVVVIGPGALAVGDGKAAAARRVKAHAAHPEPWEGCQNQNFCLYANEGPGYPRLQLAGPSHVGNGWYNLSPLGWNNDAEAMVNHRDNGDSLLADGANGAGGRYCAQQHSLDSTFSNNGFMNVASSFALLPSTIDRC